MLRVTGCLLLCGVLVTALPFPFPEEPVPSAVPVVPTAFPVAPTPGPLAPGYKNPYYNFPNGAAIPILAYSNEHGLDGKYAFSFATADGKQVQESGYLKDAFIDKEGNPQGTQVGRDMGDDNVVQGSYAYISPDGTPIEVTYVADENGFRPSGVHIAGGNKKTVPTLDKDGKIINSPYNPYNPYLNGNQYNYYGQYNRPYDPRYSFNSSRYNPYYNNYNPYDGKKYNVQTYDPRFPYDQSRYNPFYNNYNPTTVKPISVEEPKQIN